MINLENFTSGSLRKDLTGYRYFVPSQINEEWIWSDPQINILTERAAIKLGELNSFSKLVPNIDLFIQLHVTKEAVVSSRIEGTQTQMDEALMDEEEILPERRNDWKAVKNYIKALNTAITELEELPISSRLLRLTHEILLDSVRGEQKMPGVFRASQNWIGGSSLNDAAFIPPHQSLVGGLMGDLEKFIHNEEIKVPDLIKIAIAHYQFETIHPFLDGNGRIGRLLITLFLVDKNILSKPLLYLSAFFEKNKGLYYDNLTFVRTRNDMKQWIKYFLVGVEEMASSSSQTLSNIMDYKTKTELYINTHFGKRSQSALQLFHYLLKQPVVSVNRVQQVTELKSYGAANSLVTEFLKQNFLQEITGNRRNRLFKLESYINLFKT